MHLIWQIGAGQLRENVQRDFLKFTVRQIRFDLRDNNPELLKSFEVNAADRKHQIWERNPLSTDLYSHNVFIQKLNYIHNNPVAWKWSLCTLPEEYHYSSALFCQCGIKNWGFFALSGLDAVLIMLAGDNTSKGEGFKKRLA